MQKRKGFTTVELVIVIAVIAILATALIPTFGGLIESANRTVDVQLATSLTTLVKMYDATHKIESEIDLANAINAEMGEGYYENLEPKSAKYGYCFWYDYKNKQVKLGNVDEITEESLKNNPPVDVYFSGWDITMGIGVPGTFAGGLRKDIVDGYFLMGYKGSNELLDLVIGLETADATSYATTYGTLKTLADANTTSLEKAANKLKENLSTILIHNENGMIVPSGNIESVYIPLTATAINSKVAFQYDQVNGKVTTGVSVPTVTLTEPLYIPTGFKLETGSLMYLSNSSEIVMDVSADQLKDYVAAEATNAAIRTNDAQSFKLISREEGNKWFKKTKYYLVNLSNNAEQEIKKTNDLRSFAVNLSGADGYVTNGVIYISADHTGSFELVADSFLDYQNNAVSCGSFSWKTGADSESLTDIENVYGPSCSFEVVDGSIIHVETLGVDYEYQVKVFDAKAFGIYSVGNAKNVFTLDYIPGINQSWTVNSQIAYTNDQLADLIPLNTAVTIYDDPSGMFSIENGRLQFNGNKDNTFRGQKKVTLTFKCRDLLDSIEIILIDASSNSLSIADNANTALKYDFNFTVGTANGIPLKYLLKQVAGKTLTDDISISIPNAGFNPNPISKTDWQNEIVTLAFDSAFWTDTVKSNVAELTMIITSGNTTVELPLTVVNGAHNVFDADSWKGYGKKTGTDIAIVKGFTIDANEADSAANYTLELGAGTIYGNFQTINVTNTFKFYSASYSGHYLILVNGGTLEKMIIEGPDYGNDVAIDGDTAKSMGTFVPGVRALNATITDCFLSGFRSPLHVATVKENGTMVKNNIVLTNTTLHRGNMANLFIESTCDITFNNVTTIQYESSSTHNIGSGIFIKYRSPEIEEVNLDVTLHGTITQHNLVSIDQMNSLASLMGDVVSIDMQDHLPTIEKLAHTANNEACYDAGIFMTSIDMLLYGKYFPVLHTNELTHSDGTAFTPIDQIHKSVIIMGDAYVDIYGEATADCKAKHENSCSHTIPTQLTQDHIDNFIVDYINRNSSN